MTLYRLEGWSLEEVYQGLIVLVPQHSLVWHHIWAYLFAPRIPFIILILSVGLALHVPSLLLSSLEEKALLGHLRRLI